MNRIFLSILIALMAAAVAVPEAAAYEAPRKEKSSAAGKRTRKNASRPGRKKSSAQSSSRRESSADIRKREQETHRDIKKTEAEIRANEKRVSKEVADLNRLGAEISAGKQEVSRMTTQLGVLDNKITGLNSTISASEKELARMREKYLQAVRKMQATKGNRSTLAFVFASKSFNQAMRRMRYLRQFSEWREKQSELIAKKVKRLKYESDLLAQTQADKRRVLDSRVTAQRRLEQQHSQQDALVVSLRKNGDALRSHLARKQAEANELHGRIAAVIAREQREAEERRAREEQQRLAREEEQRRKEEAAAREQQLAQERARQEEAERITQEKSREKAQAKDQEKRRKQELDNARRLKEKEEKMAREKAKRDARQKELAKKEKDKKRKEAEDKKYASARRRRPRDSQRQPQGNQQSKRSERKETPRQQGGSFAAAKGQLPHPAPGPFRIVSQFGRHPLPDLPGVEYDNPGIDAEVSPGAHAQAVFAGKVSGVYVLPGFNTVVIVNHGGYYTIYANIASPSVKVGDTVSQGQGLGRIAEDSDSPGHYKIHFEVWKNRDKLNPQAWIR